MPNPLDREVRLNVNVPRDLWEAFKSVAASHERSVGAHIRWLMRRAVEEASKG